MFEKFWKDLGSARNKGLARTGVSIHFIVCQRFTIKALWKSTLPNRRVRGQTILSLNSLTVQLMYSFSIASKKGIPNECRLYESHIL